MIQLLRNAVVYRDGAWRPSDILVADKRIERIDDAITCDYDGLVGTDCRGMTAIPGYIDQHVHLTGGGGEGSFITQVPPLKYSEPVKAGVTTMVGLLGTDGTTRSVANLVARTKAFREFGLTAYCLTGNYNYPSPTLTGSVMDDIVFVDEIIGVKIAISDHRSSNMTKESLIKLASDARVAGMLSGKPGIVHLHTGTGKAQLDMLFDIVAETEIPIRTFRPTHLAAKYDAAIRFAKLGGYIDFTCDPDDMVNRSALLVRALREAPAGSVTISTDSNGSLPVWNERNEMIGIGAGHISALHDTICAMVKLQHCPLEEALLPVTENVAKALELDPAKGVLAAGSDADIVLLDSDMAIDTVYVMGRCMLKNKEMQVHANFEF